MRDRTLHRPAATGHNSTEQCAATTICAHTAAHQQTPTICGRQATVSSLTSPHGGKPILLTRRRLRHRHRHRRTISRSNSACTTEAPGTGIDGRDGLSPAYYRYLSAFLSCAWRPAFERSDIAPARRQLARTFWSHRLSRPGCRLASAAIADTP